MNIPVPAHYTAYQGQLVLRLLEVLIDTLADFYTAMDNVYGPVLEPDPAANDQILEGIDLLSQQ